MAKIKSRWIRGIERDEKKGKKEVREPAVAYQMDKMEGRGGIHDEEICPNLWIIYTLQAMVKWTIRCMHDDDVRIVERTEAGYQEKTEKRKKKNCLRRFCCASTYVD